jgi:amidohydrolase
MDTKALLLDTVAQHRTEMFKAEQHIFKNAETGFREWKTNAYMTEKFEAMGYTLTQAGNIPGFIADLDTGRPGPKICIMAELDSLIVPDHPDAVSDTGAAHACGHHAQCAALLGVAAALKAPGALDELSGSIRFAVVPAEELIEIGYRESLRRQGIIKYFGGKVEFLYRGLLDGVDIIYMVHTSANHPGGFGISPGNNGCITKNIEYKGRAAHAGGSPHRGVNALYAAQMGLAAINALRETFKDSDHIRVHPIITEGGQAVNAIPDRVKLESYVRGSNLEAIVAENRKVNRALAAGAAALGAEVVLSDRFGYMPLQNDANLSKLALECMAQVVPEDKISPNEPWSSGSTDMGDMSTLMPVLHPMVGGACGVGHGNNYRIDDPETALVKCAQFQVLFAHKLLSDGAKAAREVIAAKKVVFSSKEEYFAFVDKVAMDKEGAVYNSDGTITLDYTNL